MNFYVALLHYFKVSLFNSCIDYCAFYYLLLLTYVMSLINHYTGNEVVPLRVRLIYHVIRSSTSESSIVQTQWHYRYVSVLSICHNCFIIIVKSFNWFNSQRFSGSKTETGVFSISAFLVKTFMKKLRNFRTSYGTDVKLQSLSKLEKRDTSTSKKN